MSPLAPAVFLLAAGIAAAAVSFIAQLLTVPVWQQRCRHCHQHLSTAAHDWACQHCGQWP